MKKKIYQPSPLILNEGYFIDRQFNSLEGMEENSKNWEHHCTYQLSPNAFAGHYQVLQLHSMQLLYAQRAGGFMYDVSSAQDCISVGVLEECMDKACFGQTKLQAGDIIFFDDSRPFNMIANDTIVFTVLSIRKSAIGSFLPKFSNSLNHTIKDIDALFATTLRQVREHFAKDTNKKDFKDAEEKIYGVIMKLLEEQTPIVTKLTKGEKIAFAIRDQVYHHMDGKVNIETLSKQHHVSEKTLQKSFKSLFGFTPKHFFQQLKLNHVYHDLKYADPHNETVTQVAYKWGFTQMGHFSNYYTALFGESPLQTLKSPNPREEFMEGSCVERQEEI